MAIAIDATSEGFANSTTLSFSHTCTGSNRLLLVSYFTFPNADAVSGITYATVPMTKLATLAADAGGVETIYGLIAPAIGANNIVFTISPSSQVFATAASYTGVSQTGLPDNFTTNTGTATSLTTALTTIADNCWIVFGGRENGGTIGAGTNTSLRIANSTSPDCALFDTNAAQTPAGSHSVQTTNAASKTFFHAVVSIAPVATAVTHFLSLVGVGL